MTKPDPDRPEPKPQNARHQQEDRLAKALRENLKRRKAPRPTAAAPAASEASEDPPRS